MNLPPLYTFSSLQEALNSFLKSYSEIFVITCPDKKMSHKPQKERVCRFCKRPYNPPDVRFKKEAHIIPHFLGNRYLTSDFECDSCNERFGLNENDFKNALGIIPSLTKTPGKKSKLPTFISHANEVIASRSNRLPIDGDFVEVSKSDPDSDTLTFDFKNGKHTAKFKKNPYTPYNVYKTLLKIGLSCLPQEDIKYYPTAFEALLSNKTLSPDVTKVHVTSLPMGHGIGDKPVVHLFRKKDRLLNVPTHLIALHYQHLIYQFFLPYHVLDEHVYSQAMLLDFCPPLFNLPVSYEVKIDTLLQELSSTEVLRDEIQEMESQFVMPPTGQFYKFDPRTQEHTAVEDNLPTDIVGYVITPHGTTLNFPTDKRKG